VRSRPLVAIDVRPLSLAHVTGVGLLIQQILEELPARGFDFVGISDCPVPDRRRPGGIPVRVDAGAGGRIYWEASTLPGLLRSLDPKPDLYHATWNHGVPRGLPFPSVLSLLDMIPWVRPQYVPWPKPAPLHRWLYRRTARRSARAARVIVTLSEQSRRDIVSRIPGVAGRIEVVPCALPRWFARPQEAAVARWRERYGGGPYWLYLGGFDPRKGLDVLAEAAGLLADAGAPVKPLVLAGALNATAEEVRRALLARGVLAHFPGYVPDEELAPLVSGASLFLYPSRYEGFGIPPLLAMAVGVPCVVADGGALPEVVSDAAVVVRAGHAPSLAQGIREALGRGPELADRGRERAARFSVDVLAGRMTQVYERALRSPAGSA
jgi:glycosyltransferase involved in cell wall biosynthesis